MAFHQSAKPCKAARNCNGVSFAALCPSFGSRTSSSAFVLSEIVCRRCMYKTKPHKRAAERSYKEEERNVRYLHQVFWLIKLQPSSVQQFIKYLILWIMIIMFSFHNFFPDVIIYYICICKPHIPSPRSDSQIFLSLQKVQMRYFLIYRISYFLRSTFWTLRLETRIDLKNTSQIDGSLIN